MNLVRSIKSYLTLFILCLLAPGYLQAEDLITPNPRLPKTTPWDLKVLSKAPQFEWIDEKSPIKSLFYQGLDYRGKPTKVFAYYGFPDLPKTPGAKRPRFASVVLIHGGGGTAFREWVELWVNNGYAAIAMDLAGSRPIDGKNPHDRKNRIRLMEGGPNQSHVEKFEAIKSDKSEHWCYHAPANAILAHSLIRSFPEVDQDRSAVTGISWGGYLTCIVAGLDNRFDAAVPVYGCGFLNNHSVFGKAINQLPPADARRWMQLYDPGQYLPAMQVPIFFVNGTNDFAYWLSAYQRSYQAVPETTYRNIRIEVNMRHSHPAGWAPKEISDFISEKLNNAAPLPLVQNPAIKDKLVTAKLAIPVPGETAALQHTPKKVKSADLIYTTDEGPNPERKWKSIPLQIEGRNISGTAPPENTTIWFINVTDETGSMASSPLMMNL
ncbi:acetylxylan esterase [uncultured Gimesia sp.]|uniref:alpha/beta hydrolase family protein n=1 Tax=uncultured Gimesia sp. TaxID=1678688 RepID=UPI0026269FED|nr:acetylxylan esterase [uncultured Gimesia sp.]